MAKEFLKWACSYCVVDIWRFLFVARSTLIKYHGFLMQFEVVRRSSSGEGAMR
jgi:hypothetical protein